MAMVGLFLYWLGDQSRSTRFFSLSTHFFLLLGTIISVCVQATEVKVYAAASMTDVLTELGNRYHALHPDVDIQLAFAGSPTLAKHIENGAPADLFISADAEWPRYLLTRDVLIPESLQTLTKNALVFIAPKDSTATLVFDKQFNVSASFTGRWCTGNPASVPVGKYAKQALIYYGWWDKLSPKLVTTEDVRSALAFVERGECHLGIVYQTDAQLSKKIRILGVFPAESHSAIEYVGGLTRRSSPDAQLFWHFLRSDEAKESFARYGFLPLH